MIEAASRPAIYLETNFFIKAVEGTAEAAGPPRSLIESLRGHPGLAVTSEITFAETLAPPNRSDAPPLHVKRRAYLDLLLWSGFVVLVPVSRDVLIETADLRAARRMKLRMLFILYLRFAASAVLLFPATLILTGCRKVWSA